MARPSRNKPKKRHLKDPFAAREAQKYAKPIPSRELIQMYLADNGIPLTHEEMCEGLGLRGEEASDALNRRLKAMIRDGQLILNRRDCYCLIEQTDLVSGRVLGHPDGFGFLRPDEGGDDLFVSPREMRSLMHDDRALVRIKGVDRRGRQEAAVVKILERNTHRVVGRFYDEQGVLSVVPDKKNFAKDILIPETHRNNAKHGRIVVVEIIEQPSRRQQPIGKIIQVLGEHMAPGMEIEVAIRTYDLPAEWPESVVDEADRLGPSVAEHAKKARIDIRALPLLTIDGEDAKDFDDAVYCERKPKGWRLLVAIADVSHYVLPGTELDQEAHKRGNSVYFPERVIPMLPETLSNGLCSLKPKEDRLCMVCELSVDFDGKLKRSRFFKAVMRSHARMTYNEVAKILEEKDKKTQKKYAALLPTLNELYALYKALRKVRESRGAIDFDTQEPRILFGPKRKIERIVPLVRNNAHRLIEECMILANTASARFLTRKKIPHLLRSHDGPSQEKLGDLRTFLGGLGFRLEGGDKPQPSHYMGLIEEIRGRQDARLIQTVLLRSLSQAVYSTDRIGHFGLALDSYTHFTSPIRRYPDLLVHRAIKQALANTPIEKAHYSHNDMVVLGEHCSTTERRADEATRDVLSWLKCEYMLDKLGDSFNGIISSVTSFGLFVELTGIFVEGLVHVATLDRDYFHFDAAGHRLYGERSGVSYRLGDAVRVKVARVDLDERKIDFDLVKPGKRKGRR